MNKKHRRILRCTLGGVLLGTSITAGFILAAPTPSRQTPLIVSSEKKGQIPIDRCELPPAVGGMICTPNARDHGYFEGTWRRWPTQTRMDQHNPGAVLRPPITPAAKHPIGTLEGIPEVIIPSENNGMGDLVPPDILTPPGPPRPQDTLRDGEVFDPSLFGENGKGNGVGTIAENGHGNGHGSDAGNGLGNGEITDPDVTQAGGEMTVGEVIDNGVIGPVRPGTGYTTPDNGDFEPPSFPMPEMKTQEDLDRSIDGVVPGHSYEGAGTSPGAQPDWLLASGAQTEPSLTMPATISTPTAVAAPVPPALEGFCPVSLLQTEQWVRGDPRYPVTYHGKTYLLSSQEKVHEFLADPRRFTPVLDGNDPVAMRGGRQIGGLADFCLVYEGRLYMFASEDAMNEFSANARDLRDFADYTERLMQE